MPPHGESYASAALGLKRNPTDSHGGEPLIPARLADGITSQLSVVDESRRVGLVSSVESEVERLYGRCSGLSGRPVRLEALWDGDTQGWFLCLSLTTRSWLGRETRHFLEALRYGSDLRLFNAQVPPWPESTVAKHLAEKLGCELWFPSPDQPDDDNPSYAERATAVSCSDCSKLFKPSQSPHLPKDICYHCSLNRSTKAKLGREPGDDDPHALGIYLVLDTASGQDVRQLLYCSAASDTFERLQGFFRRLNEPEALLHDRVLSVRVTTELSAVTTQELAAALATYSAPTDDFKRRFCREVEWDGARFLLDLHFDRHHQLIAELVHLARCLREAVSSGGALRIYTNAGVKYRDVHVLRKLQAAEGAINLSDVISHWAEQLGSASAVHESIERLRMVGCLVVQEGKVSLTCKGGVISISAEGG